MKQTAGPSSPAGLGLFASSLPCGPAWGHGGGILDYGTEVAVSGDGRRVVVISVRTGPAFSGHPPIPALMCPASSGS